MFSTKAPRAGAPARDMFPVSDLATLIAEQLEPGCGIQCLTDDAVAEELSVLLPQYEVAASSWWDSLRRVSESGQGEMDALANSPPLGEDEGCKGIVLQGSLLLSVSPLPLFNAAYRLLAPTGYLYVLFEPTSLAETIPISSRQLEYLCAIAKRIGLSVDASTSSSSQVAGVGRLVVYRRSPRISRWILEHSSAKNLAELQSLFRVSFGSDFAADLWMWKYGGARGRSVVARHNGRMVAHYGSMIRAVSYFGKPGTGLQICDVMVDPRERGVLTKKGAMFLIAVTYLEIYLGLRGNTLAYGFPTRRQMTLAERLGLYAEVAQMVEVRWTAKPRPRTGVRSNVLVGRGDSERRRVDRLWRRMEEDLRDAIVVVRDWEYIKYRYFDHPQQDYTVICVRHRLSRRSIGIVVLKREADQCELVDIVAPLCSLGRLIEEARSVAAQWGAPSVCCWITRHEAWRFTALEGSVKPLDISVPTNIWVDGPSVQQLSNKWWLMSGDTDFR